MAMRQLGYRQARWPERAEYHARPLSRGGSAYPTVKLDREQLEAEYVKFAIACTAQYGYKAVKDDVRYALWYAGQVRRK